MPYIKEERRLFLEPELTNLINKMKELNSNNNELTKGDINYICYKLGLEFIYIKEFSYQNISDSVDGIRGAAEELKRRIQDPYEDTKIYLNGDIEINK